MKLPTLFAQDTSSTTPVPAQVTTVTPPVNNGLDEMKQNFVSIAAHELRTPLTAIKGYLSVFMKDYESSLNKDQKELLGHIESSTNQLLNLVENLLNVSRVERGALSLHTESLDWPTLVKEGVEDFRENAVEKNIHLELAPASNEIPKVLADKVRIKEVLANLIANALNYTPTGGIVKVSIENGSGEVITHVADNGSGIPEGALPNLFNKFFRVTHGLTQNTNAQGTGLGLYISKAIIDMHKGKIWVRSLEGKGSIFSFSLPV